MFRFKKIYYFFAALIIFSVVVLVLKLQKNNQLDRNTSLVKEEITLPVRLNNEDLTTSDIELTSIFEDLTLGYSINYRGDWFYEKPDNQSVVFSGKKETEAYYSTLQLRNISSKNYGYRPEDAVNLINDLKKQFSSSEGGGALSEIQTFDFTVEGEQIIKGYMFVAEYIYKNIAYRQWQLVIPRADGQVFYNISYTSSKGDYERYLPIIKAMIGSLEIK